MGLEHTPEQGIPCNCHVRGTAPEATPRAKAPGVRALAGAARKAVMPATRLLPSMIGEPCGQVTSEVVHWLLASLSRSVMQG